MLGVVDGVDGGDARSVFSTTACSWSVGVVVGHDFLRRPSFSNNKTVLARNVWLGRLLIDFEGDLQPSMGHTALIASSNRWDYAASLADNEHVQGVGII